jgi:hypothetical protein
LADDDVEVGKTVETKFVIGIPPRVERTVRKFYGKRPRFQIQTKEEQLRRLLEIERRPPSRRRVRLIRVGSKIARLVA